MALRSTVTPKHGTLPSFGAPFTHGRALDCSPKPHPRAFEHHNNIKTLVQPCCSAAGVSFNRRLKCAALSLRYVCLKTIFERGSWPRTFERHVSHHRAQRSKETGRFHLTVYAGLPEDELEPSRLTPACSDAAPMSSPESRRHTRVASRSVRRMESAQPHYPIDFPAFPIFGKEPDNELNLEPVASAHTLLVEPGKHAARFRTVT